MGLDPNADFEIAFQKIYGVPHALTMASGTSAYLASLLALEIPRDKEILIPAYTWPQLFAAPKAIGYRHVKFIDCDSEGRMSLSSLKRIIGKKTGVVVVCHLFGNPENIREIVNISQGMSVPVIEDCSQSLFSWQHGRKVGTWGDVAFSSLGKGKVLSVGEGGMFWTHDSVLYRRAMTISQRPERFLERDAYYRCLIGSLSLRMHPKAALMGIREVSRLKERVSCITSKAEILRCLISDVEGIRSLIPLDDAVPTWQSFPIVVEKKLDQKLNKFYSNIQSAYMIGKSKDAPNAELFSKRVRFLEIGRRMEHAQTHNIKEIAAKIRQTAS